MINCKEGDILLRIVPPYKQNPAYSQAGKVTKVTEKTIEMDVQVDVIRKMRFDRTSGLDESGIGSYVVAQDLSLNRMVPIQQAWEWAGGNPGMTPSLDDLKEALVMLNQICDQTDAAQPSFHAGGPENVSHSTSPRG